MPFEQLTFDQVMANVLRSELQTLRNFHEASMRTKGVAVPSVHVYGARVIKTANGVLNDTSSYPTASRWARKVIDYANQHGLSQDVPGQ